MVYGYARVSTQDQNLELQVDALEKQGCGKIFREKVSGGKSDRPQLNKMLSILQPGDKVVVWKLDRLGRSVKDLILLTNDWKERGIGFASVQDSIDTSTPMGRFFFNVMASLTELEREMVRERTVAGLQAARSRGRKGGRPKGLSDAAKVKAIGVQRMYGEGCTIYEIMQRYGISKPTVYRYTKTAL